MKKVLVIGSPGAGKTEFSKLLSKSTGLPLIHLDRYFNDESQPYIEDRQAWRNKVAELLKAKSWIMDGNYKATLDIRVPAADTVVYLDYPTYFCLLRVFRRRLKYHRKVRGDMPDGWKEKISLSFLRDVAVFNHRSAKINRAILERYKDKVTIVTFTRPMQVKRYLSGLDS